MTRLKNSKSTLEKDSLLSEEEKKLLERKIKSDEIKIGKIKAALEFLEDTDLKIITSIFFEKVTNKDMAAQLNVSKEFINRHKRESMERIADIMYGHLVGSNFSSSYLQD
ncbi:sigma-70 RNA polymerase sigma factor region 4 domain-containing protein [Clostridium saccharoperbutylacetonicum]